MAAASPLSILCMERAPDITAFVKPAWLQSFVAVFHLRVCLAVVLLSQEIEYARVLRAVLWIVTDRLTNTTPTFTICLKLVSINEIAPTISSVVSFPFVKPACSTGTTLSNTGDINVSIILSRSL